MLSPIRRSDFRSGLLVYYVWVDLVILQVCRVLKGGGVKEQEKYWWWERKSTQTHTPASGYTILFSFTLVTYRIRRSHHCVVRKLITLKVWPRPISFHVIVEAGKENVNHDVIKVTELDFLSGCFAAYQTSHRCSSVTSHYAVSDSHIQPQQQSVWICVS